jgi:hypothetical protein
MPSRSTCALWLKPSGAAYDVLTRTIRNLARKLDAPVFEAHVTLLGELKGSEDEQVRRGAALARQLRPFQIRLTEPSYGDTYFQCVFMLVEETPALMSANTLASSVFGRAGTSYLPHVSLVYGRWPQARRQEIMSQLPPDLQTSFQATTLHLIEAASSNPKNWREIAAWSFTG